jgi:hypothetical protein
MFKLKINTNSKITVAIMTLLLCAGVSFSFLNNANAAQVASRSLKLSNSAVNEK